MAPDKFASPAIALLEIAPTIYFRRLYFFVPHAAMSGLPRRKTTGSKSW
jgi:hypothetical protein